MRHSNTERKQLATAEALATIMKFIKDHRKEIERIESITLGYTIDSNMKKDLAYHRAQLQILLSAFKLELVGVQHGER